MRSQFSEDLLRIDQVTGRNVNVRSLERFVKRRSVSFIEPVTGVQWQQLYFSALGEIRGFVDDQPAGVNACLDGPCE